jgi:hypothetical protein
MPTLRRACIASILQCGHQTPRRNSSYGVAHDVLPRYRRSAARKPVPWPLAGNDNAVGSSVDGHLIVTASIVTPLAPESLGHRVHGNRP